MKRDGVSMLFKFILCWLSASFMLSAAAINDLQTTSTSDYFDPNALTQTPDPIGSVAETSLNDNTSLEKRYNYRDAPFTCHGNDYGYAEVDSIVQGIKHLYSTKGKPSNGARSCGRVSCSNNAAIWWCNNSHKPMTIDSFTAIAEGASYVQEKCSIWDYDTGKEVVSGETSPGQDWSVVVRKNDC